MRLSEVQTKCSGCDRIGVGHVQVENSRPA